MIVYNIRKAKYASSLIPSGIANRWNKEEEFIIYTGSSIALSTLELVAHRSYIKLPTEYKLLFINLNIKSTDITEVSLNALQKNWQSIQNYPTLQEIGSTWYNTLSTLVLKVPSAIIPWESNYLINTKHKDFVKKVTIQKIENFIWDSRLL